MIPIQEQGDGKGIGHSLDTFLSRFDDICKDHLTTGRATSFAFIFYDLDDRALKRILKDHGVFTKLDRLSGQKLSLFYLHNPADPRNVKSFNEELHSRLGVSSSGPCIVFFRFEEGRITNLQVSTISSTDVMHGFQEIYEIVSDYLSEEPAVKKPPKRWVFLRAGVQWIGKEAITSIVKEAIENGRVLEHLEKFIGLHQ